MHVAIRGLNIHPRGFISFPSGKGVGVRMHFLNSCVPIMFSMMFLRFPIMFL